MLPGFLPTGVAPSPSMTYASTTTGTPRSVVSPLTQPDPVYATVPLQHTRPRPTRFSPNLQPDPVSTNVQPHLPPSLARSAAPAAQGAPNPSPYASPWAGGNTANNQPNQDQPRFPPSSSATLRPTFVSPPLQPEPTTPAPDTVASMLRRRAAVRRSPKLKIVMQAVAAGEASPEQLAYFQKNVNELEGWLGQQRAAKTTEPEVTATGTPADRPPEYLTAFVDDSRDIASEYEGGAARYGAAPLLQPDPVFTTVQAHKPLRKRVAKQVAERESEIPTASMPSLTKRVRKSPPEWQPDNILFFRKQLAEIARGILRGDRKWISNPCTPLTLANALMGAYVSVGNGRCVWMDAYRNVTGTLPTGSLEYLSDQQQIQSSGQTHPFQMSIDQVHQIWIRQDNAVVFHDVGNVVLTSLCTNLMKGTLPPCILPVLKRSLELKVSVNDQPPRQGYHSQVKEDWDLVERAFDHVFAVHLQVPRERKKRLLVEPTSIAQIVSLGKSGVWDTKTRPYANFATLSKSRSAHGDWWSDEEWATLLNVVSQIEADTVRFNKHKLKIPRLGTDATPWLFGKDSYPKEGSNLGGRALTLGIYSERRHRMVELCDKTRDVRESAATLFIEHAVQWLETGGKCHFFGFELTWQLRHPRCLSIGRGVTQQLPDGTTREVQPGEAMQTGCTVLLPRDISSDYDHTRRTIVFESARANMLRGPFASSPTLISSLEQHILSLADETEWYDKLGSIDDYPPLPLLREHYSLSSYRDAWRALCTEDTAEGGEDIEIAETTEEEEDDYDDDLIDEQGEKPRKESDTDATSKEAPAGKRMEHPKTAEAIRHRQAMENHLEAYKAYVAGVGPDPRPNPSRLGTGPSLAVNDEDLAGHLEDFGIATEEARLTQEEGPDEEAPASLPPQLDADSTMSDVLRVAEEQDAIGQGDDASTTTNQPDPQDPLIHSLQPSHHSPRMEPSVAREELRARRVEDEMFLQSLPLDADTKKALMERMAPYMDLATRDT